MDRRYVMTALGYAILGLALGIYMAASHDHGQLVTHAHIMLVGFLLSFVYALCHKLWLPGVSGRLATIQFYLHQAGAVLLTAGLFVLYGKLAAPTSIEPVLSLGSIAVFVALVLMKVLFIKSRGVAPVPAAGLPAGS